MERYEMPLAAAYVRGANPGGLSGELLTKPLEELTQAELERIVDAGNGADLKLYHFKKKEMLPRVKAVLGFLRGIQPESLLDVGSGRGAFLFPFLTEFPWTRVTSVDLLPHRVEFLQCLSAGGVSNLTALQQDLCTWNTEETFDVVTLLEVLEHIPNVAQAVRNAVAMARRYVVVTVPSKPDDNPEHIHLLTQDVLTDLFKQAGCEKLRFSGVPGHLVLVASVEK